GDRCAQKTIEGQTPLLARVAMKGGELIRLDRRGEDPAQRGIGESESSKSRSSVGFDRCNASPSTKGREGIFVLIYHACKTLKGARRPTGE
ncbi:MAG: hypothetical protein KY475_11180, partial [Planctomycetes bacterium]|nr:hypothetical protein [Planctomycetota bacterium]